MIGTQNSPTALTWWNCFIACLLAAVPTVPALMIMMIAERTDFPSASFFVYAIGILDIFLYQISGVFLLWLGILYFIRRRELGHGSAILIGVLVEALIRLLFVLKDTSESFSAWNPLTIAFYFLMPQFFLAPAGVIGGLAVWLYLRRARKNLSQLVGLTTA